MRTASRPSKAISTSTELSGSEWQSGMSSDVRLAAPIPAMRATARASPFFNEPAFKARRAAADIRTSARATATRLVIGFSSTSTMRALPSRVMCVRADLRGRTTWLRSVTDPDNAEHEKAERPAIDGERRQTVIADKAHEESDGEQAAHKRDDRADRDDEVRFRRCAEACDTRHRGARLDFSVAENARQFENRRAEDRRSGHEEGEPRCLFARQAGEHARAYGKTGTRSPRNDTGDLAQT